jgi:hypothetical protein
MGGDTATILLPADAEKKATAIESQAEFLPFAKREKGCEPAALPSVYAHQK